VAETPPRLCATDLPPSLPPTSRAVIRGRLDFVVAVHGLQGRLRLTIAMLELGPRGLCLPHVVVVPVWERVARPPAGPSAAHATPKSSLGATPSGSLRLHWRRTPAHLLGAAPSGSLRLHWRRTPPLPLTPRRPFPRGAPRRRQARPLVPRDTLGGRPARRRVVEGARYGGPDPEGLHPATPCRRRPQGRDVAIDGARGARLCDEHDRTPKGLPCSSHSQALNPPPAMAAIRQLAVAIVQAFS
jgi:hypothetical protein